MAESTRRVVLKGEMTYAEAKAAFGGVWPNVPIFFYRPTIEHYKEGYPTAEELELMPEEPLSRFPGREAVIHGDLRMQLVHSTIMGGLSVETALRGDGIHAYWMSTLDEANAGARRIPSKE